MIDLYYWPTPNGHKITIALEELNLAYRIKTVNIGEDEQFKPAFLKISPNNRIPAIVDSDPITNEKPFSLFESGAILEYLAAKTGKLLPSDNDGIFKARQWLHWQMGGFGPMLGQAHHFLVYAPEKVPYGIKRYTNEAKRLYGVLNKQLESNKWVAGDSYTIADIAIYPWAKSHEKQEVDINKLPAVKSWFETMSKRPAVEKAYKIAEEYSS